jgi:uncharacterized phage protein (TIGR02218 family)
MSRVWFAQPLETVATFWRVMRRDGVTLGFTTHDRDLWFDGVRHSATPGMVPSAIRRSAGFEADSAEVEGALTNDSLSAADLAAGRFDGARVIIGLIDWQTLAVEGLYRGTIGAVVEEAGKFTAELQSRKAELLRDPVPRTSPSCRARFCGPGCTLPAVRFTHEAVLTGFDLAANRIAVAAAPAPAALAGGEVRWCDGPHAGSTMTTVAADDEGLVLDQPLDPALVPGLRLLLREGCDHRLATCAARFANAANFQGEPFLPGNDQIYRYPPPSQQAQP